MAGDATSGPVELAEALRLLIEQLVDILDSLEGDADLEGDDAVEVETDQNDAPVTLNRTELPPKVA
ncbi:hypothetical protein [Devosia alba]|uniref:hypothetical protein n=1 Tax=Devosia alba TaxID=3152360 RepID=UPI0032678BF3